MCTTLSGGGLNNVKIRTMDARGEVVRFEREPIVLYEQNGIHVDETKTTRRVLYPF